MGGLGCWGEMGGGGGGRLRGEMRGGGGLRGEGGFGAVEQHVSLFDKHLGSRRQAPHMSHDFCCCLWQVSSVNIFKTTPPLPIRSVHMAQVRAPHFCGSYAVFFVEISSFKDRYAIPPIILWHISGFIVSFQT